MNALEKSLKNLSPSDVADIILSKHWDGKLPVDPIQIASRLGLDVYSSSKIESGGGKLRLNDQGKLSIYINPKDSTVRQRFTIFHEIGHFLLHGHSEDGEMNRTYGFSPAYDQKELEADEFAAEMLMPRSFLKSCVNKGYSFEKLMNLFQASAPAMSRRLRELKLA